MRREVYFDDFFGRYWPSLDELKPYFFAPPGHEWPFKGGNDSAGLDLIGLDGTEHLPFGNGQKWISLSMWGNPKLGVLLEYKRFGGEDPPQAWYSKGDMQKIRQWVRSLHDTPLPVGLFIPFDRAWLAVKEFMETEGMLPTSIEWINSSDLPKNTFPDPTVRLPGEPDNDWPPLEV
jgi:hypothetical protein